MSQEQECEGIDMSKHCKAGGKGIGALVTVVQGCDECGCEAAEKTASDALKAAEEAQKTADSAEQAAQEAQKTADAAAERAEEAYEKALGYYIVDPEIRDLDSFFTAPEKRWLTHTASVNAPYQAAFPAYFETRLNSGLTSVMQIFRSEGSGAVTWIRFAAVDRANPQSPTAVWTDWRTETKPDSRSTMVNADGSVSVQLKQTGGIDVDESGLFVNPGTLSEEAIAGLLKHLRLPRWLDQNTTWYVRTDGNDNNDGSADSPDKAFRTLQAAILHVTEKYNLGAYTATIQVASGVYAEDVILGQYAASTGSIVLNGTSSADTIISGSVQSLAGVGTYSLSNVEVQWRDKGASVDTYWTGIQANQGSKINVSNVSVSTPLDVRTTYATGINAVGGEIYLGANVTVNGKYYVFISADGGKVSQASLVDVTVNGTATAYMMSVANLGQFIRIRGTAAGTFTGSVTGRRYQATSNAILNTRGAGATYFPGTLEGVVSNGGQYL